MINKSDNFFNLIVLLYPGAAQNKSPAKLQGLKNIIPSSGIIVGLIYPLKYPVPAYFTEE